jgi:hypothetical protein
MPINEYLIVNQAYWSVYILVGFFSYETLIGNHTTSKNEIEFFFNEWRNVKISDYRN